jgi:hypothetical protein
VRSDNVTQFPFSIDQRTSDDEGVIRAMEALHVMPPTCSPGDQALRVAPLLHPKWTANERTNE